MEWRQFVAWRIYHFLEPFGPTRRDLRAGQVVAAVYNVNRDTKTRPQPFSASDFVLKFTADNHSASTKRANVADKWNAYKRSLR